MTTAVEFYALVSTEIRRGTTLDSSIPRKVQQAVRWMEDQHTFGHMEHYASLLIDSTVSSPRAIVPPSGFKKMVAWRGLEVDQDDSDESSYFDINKVDFYDVSRIEVARPTSYWQDGMDYFWLDNTPDQDYDTEMAYDGYTVVADAGASPYIFQQFEALILAKTMILFAPLLRDPAVSTFYQPEVDSMMKAAIDSDVEARQGWQSQSVQYGWEERQIINLRRGNDND